MRRKETAVIGTFRTIGSVVVVALFYEWFVVSAISSELVAATIVGIATTIVMRRLSVVRPPEASISAAFLVPLVRRVIPSIVSESVELLGPVLWQSVVLGRPVRGRWIALRYDPRDTSAARERGRRTVVVVGSNLTPNALPLDVDVANGRIVLHQLVARRESAASDPRYPM